MATLIRPEISKKNKYWISKHRHYELKHFCLQYPMWKREYDSLNGMRIQECQNGSIDAKKEYYSDRINLVERISIEADEFLHKYILKAVTEELSFTYLKTKLGMPCGKDMYYDRYRKFFWLLSESRK